MYKCDHSQTYHNHLKLETNNIQPQANGCTLFLIQKIP